MNIAADEVTTWIVVASEHSPIIREVMVSLVDKDSVGLGRLIQCNRPGKEASGIGSRLCKGTHISPGWRPGM